jgi:hypothetical protein
VNILCTCAEGQFTGINFLYVPLYPQGVLRAKSKLYNTWREESIWAQVWVAWKWQEDEEKAERTIPSNEREGKGGPAVGVGPRTKMKDRAEG